jgi:hypothetical protein
LPGVWIAGIGIAALASVIRLSHGPAGTTIEFRATSVTAVIVALLWLPTLLRVIALTGGKLKTAGGEASTPGFFEAFRHLSSDTQEESLSAAAAVIDQVEVEGPPEQRSRAREAREGLEEAIGEIPRRRPEVTRRLREIARSYEQIRMTSPPGAARTREMTELVSRARGVASSGTPASSPERWFREETDGARIVALAAIQALRTPTDLPIVVAVIAEPRSAFEQFHALRAAEELLPFATREQKDLLRSAIESQLAEREGDGRWITPADPSRWAYAQHLLSSLGS